MARIPHPCVTISACLAGALLLLPLCWALGKVISGKPGQNHYGSDVLPLGYYRDQYDFDYDSTHSPEYFDNSTIEYSFFSNGSTEELERFLMEGGTDTGGDTSVTEKDESVREEKPTETTISVMNQASRSAPVYLFLTLVMMCYELLRLL